MANLTMQIPDDLLLQIRARGTDPAEALRLAAAFSLCSRGELSTSQAARLAGLTYAGFLQAAAQARIELFPVDLDELSAEINRGYTLGRKCIASHPPGESGTP